MQNTVTDLDLETHRQVTTLLGAARAAEMMELLRELLLILTGMTGRELVGPSGLALIHRLKSEAGFMGFERLSQACEAVDTAGARGGVPLDDLTNLSDAIRSALAISMTPPR